MKLKLKHEQIQYVEFLSNDLHKIKKFYTDAFGWRAEILGQEMGNYVVVRTTETEENGLPKKPGIINGGLFKKTKNKQYPSVVIAVDDIKEAMKRVAETGGKVLGGQKPDEPDDIPGVGLYASFIDTEGNRVGMLQPAQKI